ncbi:MAG: hypothetical protein V1734_02915 [Nanoarchaeota archaeon]
MKRSFTAPEEQKGPIVKGIDGIIEEMLKHYETYLPYTPLRDGFTPVANMVYEKVCGMELPILTPEQINIFLQATNARHNSQNYSFNTGLLISKLMQDSYNAGHSEFRLDTVSLDKQADNIGYGISGTGKRPIQIIITGTAGISLCTHAKHVTVYAKAIGDWCGMNAQDITVIAEKVGFGCGDHSLCTTVYADKVGIYCGFDSCRMKVHTGKIGKNYGCGEKDIWQFTLKKRSPRMMGKLKRALANGL